MLISLSRLKLSFWCPYSALFCAHLCVFVRYRDLAANSDRGGELLVDRLLCTCGIVRRKGLSARLGTGQEWQQPRTQKVSRYKWFIPYFYLVNIYDVISKPECCASIADCSIRTDSKNKFRIYRRRTCSFFIYLSKLLCFDSGIKLNKTARIRAKPWMFRLPFKVYGAVIKFKKLNEI